MAVSSGSLVNANTLTDHSFPIGKLFYNCICKDRVYQSMVINQDHKIKNDR